MVPPEPRLAGRKGRSSHQADRRREEAQHADPCVGGSGDGTTKGCDIGSHDPRIDTGGATFEEAIVNLAHNVWKLYGGNATVPTMPSCPRRQVVSVGVTVYGVSDDLIEIEGDMREEFTLPASDAGYLAFSDGTLLSVRYSDEGVWRFAPIDHGSAWYSIEQAPDGDDNNYSDRVRLGDEAGPIRWVRVGDELREALKVKDFGKVA